MVKKNYPYLRFFVVSSVDFSVRNIRKNLASDRWPDLYATWMTTELCNPPNSSRIQLRSYTHICVTTELCYHWAMWPLSYINTELCSTELCTITTLVSPLSYVTLSYVQLPHLCDHWALWPLSYVQLQHLCHHWAILPLSLNIQRLCHHWSM